MENIKSLSKNIGINAEEEISRIKYELRSNIAHILKKRGAVVGTSGGIDSSVVLSLCTKALGPDKVLAVIMPEKDSSPESMVLAKDLISILNVNHVIEDITKVLEGFGCYRRRDEAIKRIFPEYDPSFKVKINIPKDISSMDKLNFFQIVIISPEGEIRSARLPLKEYLEIVAASNLKQRSRMAMLYLHAEAHNYAVVGTGNKNEHEQGFFVKFGDGGADIKPIAHLFKTQVYQLAEHLDIPDSIKKRIPTTDTYSAEQTQEEFFFGVPFEMLDFIWYNWEQGVPAESIADALSIPVSGVQKTITDILRKMHSTEYLRKEPIHL